MDNFLFLLIHVEFEIAVVKDGSLVLQLAVKNSEEAVFDKVMFLVCDAADKVGPCFLVASAEN